MSFTDRFIKLPIKTIDRKQQDLMGKSDSEDSFMMINPFNIVKYRPSTDIDDEDENEIVSMTDISGDVTLVYLPISEFEKLLNEHQK